MASILNTVQDILSPLNKDNTTTEGSASSSPGGSTGILNLLKKKVIGDDEGTISPPASEKTSPALNPVDSEKKTTSSVPAPISTSAVGLKPISPPLSHPSSPTSPIRSISPPSPPPNARQFASTSPPNRISSTSSSQIFERNVQESHTLPVTTASSSSPSAASKIPAHIATENFIPAVLEASSIAITDGSIDPDNVEIATLPTHQPLAQQVTQHHHRSEKNGGSVFAESDDLIPPSTSHSAHSLGPSFSTDKRRLSFISFSDIVQAEQADLLDSTLLSPSPLQTVPPGFPTTTMDQVGISGITETLVRRRSPSPLRNRTAGSPPRTSAGFLPERTPQDGLVVETMGQALRKTGSGDLGKGTA